MRRIFIGLIVVCLIGATAMAVGGYFNISVSVNLGILILLSVITVILGIITIVGILGALDGKVSITMPLVCGICTFLAGSAVNNIYQSL